jgi:hypothetical protein
MISLGGIEFVMVDTPSWVSVSTNPARITRRVRQGKTFIAPRYLGRDIRGNLLKLIANW